MFTAAYPVFRAHKQKDGKGSFSQLFHPFISDVVTTNSKQVRKNGRHMHVSIGFHMPLKCRFAVLLQSSHQSRTDCCMWYRSLYLQELLGVTEWKKCTHFLFFRTSHCPTYNIRNWKTQNVSKINFFTGVVSSLTWSNGKSYRKSATSMRDRCKLSMRLLVMLGAHEGYQAYQG